MGQIRDKRLVFSSSDTIRGLLADLAATGEPINVKAKELPEDAWAKVVAVSDKTFSVQPITPLLEDTYVPLSSWRFDVNLTGAHLSFVTMSISREPDGSVSMSLPELLVSGDGRQSYRITVTGDPIPVAVHNLTSRTNGGLLDASFGGARIKLDESLDPSVECGSVVVLTGEFHGTPFEKGGLVGWLQGGFIGLAFPTGDESDSDDDSWPEFVRSLGYQHVLARLQKAA